MAKYVDRDRLLHIFSLDRWGKYDPAEVRTLIMSVEPVDIQPVVRGQWKPVHSFKENALVGWSCSVCGFEIDVTEDGFNYCPKCGADLRECET